MTDQLSTAAARIVRRLKMKPSKPPTAKDWERLPVAQRRLVMVAIERWLDDFTARGQARLDRATDQAEVWQQTQAAIAQLRAIVADLQAGGDGMSGVGEGERVGEEV